MDMDGEMVVTQEIFADNVDRIERKLVREQGTILAQRPLLEKVRRAADNSKPKAVRQKQHM